MRYQVTMLLHVPRGLNFRRITNEYLVFKMKVNNQMFRASELVLSRRHRKVCVNGSHVAKSEASAATDEGAGSLPKLCIEV